MRRLALAVLLATAGWNAAQAQSEELFTEHCAVCHQADARGVPGVYPPIAGSIGAFVTVPGGRAYLARVVSFGLFGPIKVEKRPYNGFMSPLGKLADGEIADVLNYLLTKLSDDALPGDFTPFTADEVAGYRAEPTTSSNVRREREAVLLKLRARAEGVEEIPIITGSAEDFSRNCQGCPRADGMGAPGAVPRLRRFVGYFTHLPEGRAYIATPAGVMLPHLDDARLAAVLNWTVRTFSPDELAPDFRPFTAEEVGRYRQDPPTNVMATREKLVERLQAAGVIQGDDDGFRPLLD